MDSLEDTLILLVNLALDDLYKNDSYLFKINSSEESMIFHFGRYLINHLEKNTFFDKYNVDFEYNRNATNPKIYKEICYMNEIHKILPDIILHQRGHNHKNILVIEFKKSSNYSSKRIQHDYSKLQTLTDSYFPYKYKLGLFVKLGKTRATVNIEKFINGKKQKLDNSH